MLENDEVLVAITKKNTSVLQHLLNGIANASDSTKQKHKVLIIDDEADHATVNTGGDGEEPFTDSTLEGEDEEDPTDDDSRSIKDQPAGSQNHPTILENSLHWLHRNTLCQCIDRPFPRNRRTRIEPLSPRFHHEPLEAG